MRRPLAAVLVTASAALILAYPSTSPAIPIHRHIYVDRGDRKAPVDEVVYDVAPADSDQDGFADATDDCPKQASTVNGGCPPPPPPKPEPAPASSIPEVAAAPTPAPVSVPTGSGCTGMEAESGSAGYAAYNPSSGATGCYQIIPSTAAALGCDLSTPAGQDACKNEICAEQGNGAWASSGATPCG